MEGCRIPRACGLGTVRLERRLLMGEAAEIRAREAEIRAGVADIGRQRRGEVISW